MGLRRYARWPSIASSTRFGTQGGARQARLLLALLTLGGFALRLPLLMRFPLREDEAIYGYWALHARYVDPLFLQVWPDKPPIFLWVLGAALEIWGHDPETAAAAMRWAGIVAGTLAIPVLAACARRWWGETAAVMTAALAAASPFAVSFAPTAYTDTLLLLAGSLALGLGVRQHWFWSGLWLGVAIMTKQQGLLFVPLVAPFLAAIAFRAGAAGEEHDRTRHAVGSAVLRFAVGLGVVVLPILYWDSLRWTVAPSPWDLGAEHVGGVALAPLDAWGARAVGWGELLGYLAASPWVWAVWCLALGAAAVLARRRKAARTEWLPAAGLAAWAGGFVLLHVGSSVQVWDRYLLPLVVPWALLGGWAAGEVTRATHGYFPAGERRYSSLVTAAIGMLLLVGPAVKAAEGGLPIGGDHGAYAGLDEALAAVNVPGALVFHREIGWQAQFALFDAVQSGDVVLRYYPSAVSLADSATKAPHKERFVVAPDWAPVRDLAVQLAARRLRAEVHLRSRHFTVYRIEEVPGPHAAWRVCSVPVFRTKQLR